MQLAKLRHLATALAIVAGVASLSSASAAEPAAAAPPKPYDLPYTEQRSGAASRDFVAKHPNARYQIVDYNAIELPKNMDIVFNVLYYHDLSINKIDVAVLNKKVFDSLKPGGIFFVVDHNARPGSGRQDTDKLHRIDPDVVKQEIQAAGFELVEESKLLANPADDRTWGPFT
jgi:predicted methyltransferase